METCINCKKEYKTFMFDNYNLNLCKECFDKFEEQKIKINHSVDKVTHIISCPKCKASYGLEIVDKKCETKGCNVWFFWDQLDCIAFARWIDI